MGGSARASSGGLRLGLLTLFAAVLLLIPAAQASADFTLTINFAGTGEGRLECEVETEEETFPEECGEGGVAIPEGAEVRIFPEAESGSEFIEFSGDCGPLDCELLMDEDHTVEAVFDLEPVEEFALTIDTDGTGTGTVECELETGPEQCEDFYPEEAEVRLIPVPGTGSEFIEFSGDCGPGECELFMDEDHEVTATFDLEIGFEPELTIDVSGSGQGTVECEIEGFVEECEAKYPGGTDVTLVATPAAGSEFAGYSGDCSGSTCALTMNANHAVTATFNLETASGGGGSGSGSTSAPAPTPKPPSAGKLSAAGAALYQGGKAVLKLTCKGQGPCKGSLKLVAKLKVKGKLKNVEIGKAPFSLAAGTTRTLKVKLSGAAKKVLGRARSVKATVSGTGVVKSTVTIKPTAR